MKRKKTKGSNLTYPVKVFEGDYRRALKKCRDLSKEAGRRIYLSDVLRGFMNWIANEDIEKRDRIELDKMILIFGDGGNLLRRKQRESRKNEKEKKESKTS